MCGQSARVLYFDHNATSPISAAAREAWLAAAEQFIGNPSSPHRLGARADAALDGAREKLAGWLGCKPDEIVWTSGATESINTAVHHLAAEHDGEAWLSAIEHPATLGAVREHFASRHRLLPVNRDGVLDLDQLASALRNSRPALVGVMAANNETGVLQPWEQALALCRNHRVPFLCDAAQWIGKLPADSLGSCDFVSGCAHKFGGPQGVGFLKCGVQTRPLLRGGPQEERRRAGTENVAGVLSMIAALDERQKLMATGIEERRELRGSFELALQRALPETEIVAQTVPRLWNTVSAVMPQIDCRQRWVVKLDKLGFAVSTGSACASGKEAPSHVLTAMGFAPENAGRVLRFSSGWETRAADWDELLDGLVRAERELAGRQFAHPEAHGRREWEDSNQRP